MAPPPRVSRFARSDDDSAYVLVQITPSGSKPLDLRLIATEGEAPYVATLKNDKVASLMVKNCPTSDTEWHAILTSLLSQEPLADIQATASVQSGSSISITIRKQVQGITQRLGSITLNHDENEGIELFEWCGIAANAAAKNKEEYAIATAKSQESNAIIEDLKAQLDELVRAKQEDESALLQKFRDLLNEKKVKIREQQKLLAAASFNDEGETSVPPSQPPAPEQKRRPAQSRPTKRKVHPTAVEEYSDEEGIERMDVDEVKPEPQETDSERDTEDTASIASDDDVDNDIDSADVTDATKTGAHEANKAETTKKKVEQPPPKRELPFVNRKPTKPTSKAVPATTNESETESDDEL